MVVNLHPSLDLERHRNRWSSRWLVRLVASSPVPVEHGGVHPVQGHAHQPRRTPPPPHVRAPLCWQSWHWGWRWCPQVFSSISPSIFSLFSLSSSSPLAWLQAHVDSCVCPVGLCQHDLHRHLCLGRPPRSLLWARTLLRGQHPAVRLSRPQARRHHPLVLGDHLHPPLDRPLHLPGWRPLHHHLRWHPVANARCERRPEKIFDEFSFGLQLPSCPSPRLLGPSHQQAWWNGNVCKAPAILLLLDMKTFLLLNLYPIFQVNISYFAATSPLLLTFFTLVITSFGTRGGRTTFVYSDYDDDVGRDGNDDEIEFFCHRSHPRNFIHNCHGLVIKVLK